LSHTTRLRHNNLESYTSPPPLIPFLAEAMLQKRMETLPSWCGLSTEFVPSGRLTDLLLVEGLTDLQQKQHDFVQIETTKGVRNASRKISLEKLFLPLSKLSIPPRVSVTVGVSGIGKSTLVGLFVHAWGKGELGKDFVFVLPLTFRELNAHDRLSAERLIRLASPRLADRSLLSSVDSSQTLLILDGLDEFKTRLDFSNAAVCTDLCKEVQVENLITNIIRGNLLQEVSVWITSRPTAASQIPGGLVDRMTEIQGFGDADIKDYLDDMFIEDPNLSESVMQHLKGNRPLYIMCTVPAFCKICGSSVGYFLKSAKGSPEISAVPKTLTEIYSHFFKMALCSEGTGKQNEVLRIEQVEQNCKKTMSCLGRLAFYGLIKKKFVFYEQDIKAYGVDLSSLHIGLSNRLLMKEEAPLSTLYYFPHLTFQEFLAAAYYYTASKRALFDLFVESGMSWPKLGFLNHFRNAVQKSLQSEDGHLDVFVRFLAGLLSPQANKALSGWFLARDEHHSYRSHAVGLLQNFLGLEQAVSCRTVNLMRCFHEIQNTELAGVIEEAMKNENLSGMLTPVNCSALAYVLQTSEVCAEEANLSSCLTYPAFQSLLSQLLYCNNLRLDYNQFKDNAMDLLGSILSGKDCQIQKISLAENQIGNKGAKALARSLMVNRSLVALDLRSNSIGPKGAKAIADALKINQSLLSLNWPMPNIETDRDLLVLLLHAYSRSPLFLFRLQKNSIGPQGSKKIAEALKKNWSLKELLLQENAIGDEGIVALALALRVNSTLTIFPFAPLAWGGFFPLFEHRTNSAYLDSFFFVSDLSLRGNAIGLAGAKAMAGALKVNGTLRRLNLQENLLGMDGAICIATALTRSHSLTYINLQGNRIGESGAKVITDAICTNAPGCRVEM
uniref:NACHT domain-containing protein n=2 Tax=Anolis carolinensis TaxID=28377 RepID=A0A803T7B5_ANOCA